MLSFISTYISFASGTLNFRALKNRSYCASACCRPSVTRVTTHHRKRVKSVSVTLLLKLHAQHVNLRILLFRGMAWVSALRGRRGGREVIVVVLRVELHVRVGLLCCHGGQLNCRSAVYTVCVPGAIWAYC